MGGKQVVHDVEDPPPESVPTFRAVSPDDDQIVTQQEQQNLIRGLSQRHVQMIAIAGAIVSHYLSSYYIGPRLKLLTSAG